jgi:predicted MPP superfamily phosphohydrolase
LLGRYKRGLKNAEQIQVRHNHVRSKMLPSHFDGFTLLHISDLHVDITEGATRRLNEILPGMTYDICILTGDYRGATFGTFAAALEGLARARAHLRGPIYGVLGNHDTIRPFRETQRRHIHREEPPRGKRAAPRKSRRRDTSSSPKAISGTTQRMRATSRSNRRAARRSDMFVLKFQKPM